MDDGDFLGRSLPCRPKAQNHSWNHDGAILTEVHLPSPQLYHLLTANRIRRNVNDLNCTKMLRNIWRLVTLIITDSVSIVSMFVLFPRNLGESERRENQSRSRTCPNNLC